MYIGATTYCDTLNWHKLDTLRIFPMGSVFPLSGVFFLNWAFLEYIVWMSSVLG